MDLREVLKIDNDTVAQFYVGATKTVGDRPYFKVEYIVDGYLGSF